MLNSTIKKFLTSVAISIPPNNDVFKFNSITGYFAIGTSSSVHHWNEEYTVLGFINNETPIHLAICTRDNLIQHVAVINEPDDFYSYLDTTSLENLLPVIAKDNFTVIIDESEHKTLSSIKGDISDIVAFINILQDPKRPQRPSETV